MKNTIVEKLTLEQELQQMVASAPSRAGLSAANAKLESLRLRRNEASATVVSLEKQASVSAAEVIERAKELIQRGEIPVFFDPDELRRARQALRVIEEAVQIQEREVLSLAVGLSVEVRRALRPFRQRLIDRVVVALAELESAAKADAEAVSVVSRAGADAALIGSLMLPGILGGSHAWTLAQGNDGYKV
jgi:hypothetical protein